MNGWCGGFLGVHDPIWVSLGVFAYGDGKLLGVGNISEGRDDSFGCSVRKIIPLMLVCHLSLYSVVGRPSCTRYSRLVAIASSKGL